jgi:hypothetical protein
MTTSNSSSLKAQLAGVPEPPVRRGNGVDIDVVGVTFQQRDLVSIDELTGDGPPDRAGPGDGDLHPRRSS